MSNTIRNMLFVCLVLSANMSIAGDLVMSPPSVTASTLGGGSGDLTQPWADVGTKNYTLNATSNNAYSYWAYRVLVSVTNGVPSYAIYKGGTKVYGYYNATAGNIDFETKYGGGDHVSYLTGSVETRYDYQQKKYVASVHFNEHSIDCGVTSKKDIVWVLTSAGATRTKYTSSSIGSDNCGGGY